MLDHPVSDQTLLFGGIMSDTFIYSDSKVWIPRWFYQLRNKTSGKKYIGQRKYDDVGVKYFGSGPLWNKHCKNNGGKNKNNIEVLWKEYFTNENLAKQMLDVFEKQNPDYWKITENRHWMNQCKETTDNNSSTTPEVSQKISVSNKKVFNNIEWKNTTGLIQIEKQKNTKNSDEWKNTIGLEQSKKLSNSSKNFQNDVDWRQRVGEGKWVRQSESLKRTMKSEDWLNSEKGKKSVSTRFSPEWKEKHKKTCPHCGWVGDPGNYSKHHGERCKNK